jgi:hypothetical protein
LFDVCFDVCLFDVCFDVCLFDVCFDVCLFDVCFDVSAMIWDCQVPPPRLERGPPASEAGALSN